MIESLMLFGSAARGDFDDNSDVDLLAVSKTDKPFSRKFNGIEIQFMDSDKLVELGKAGDLFALHLAKEGQIIFDFSGHFAELKKTAKIKKSYASERESAFDLAWYLHDFGDDYDPALVNKRIAWCARTVTISILAEKNEIVFSPSVLSSRFNGTEAGFLISLRRSTVTPPKRSIRLKRFLETFNALHPGAASEDAFIKYFLAKNNGVAVSTIKKLQSEYEHDGDVHDDHIY